VCRTHSGVRRQRSASGGAARARQAERAPQCALPPRGRGSGLILHVYTALSLSRPVATSALERRFLGPFLERHFGPGYPDLEYAEARRAGRLPPNVRISEFYFQSGAMLGNDDAQREYVSLNYTHAARDLAEMSINVVTVLVARRSESGRERWSLACNPDVTQDLLDAITASERPRPLVVGVVHPALPFVGNEAVVDETFFDVLLEDPACAHTLFALTREPVEIIEFALGLQASTLVRDGGTLQIGIDSTELRQARLFTRRSALRRPDPFRVPRPASLQCRRARSEDRMDACQSAGLLRSRRNNPSRPLDECGRPRSLRGIAGHARMESGTSIGVFAAPAAEWVVGAGVRKGSPSCCR
jgi:hypothetical protein